MYHIFISRHALLWIVLNNEQSGPKSPNYQISKQKFSWDFCDGTVNGPIDMWMV